MQTESLNTLSINYYQRAYQFYQKKQWDQARRVLEQGLLKWKKTAKAYHLLGLVLYYQGHFQRAVKELKQACDRENRAEYFLNLSIVLNELAQYSEGQTAYQQALKCHTQSQEQNWKENMVQKHLALATAYFKKQYFQQALEEYIKSWKLKPSDLSIQLGVARSLWQIGKKPSAFQMIKQVVKQDPGYLKARMLLADWYFENQQIPQAVNEWENVLYKDPTNATARKALLQIQDISHWN